MDTQEAYAQTEGRVARGIERQTAKIPSDVFLWAALGSLVGGVLLRTTGGRREDSVLLTQFAPVFLILGLYNKLVKVAGSDRLDR